jgi:hypothetical protein
MACKGVRVDGVPRRSRRDGHRLGSGAGIALPGTHRGVPGPGQQQRQVGATLGRVGEGRVAQLVQRPPAVGVKLLGLPGKDHVIKPIILESD